MKIFEIQEKLQEDLKRYKKELVQQGQWLVRIQEHINHDNLNSLGEIQGLGNQIDNTIGKISVIEDLIKFLNK